MKAYKVYYDKITDSFREMEFDVRCESDFTNDPESNIAGFNDQHNCDHASVLCSLNKWNEELANGHISVQKCKDCGCFFIMTVNERQWFENRDLALPKRCMSCRRKRRQMQKG